MQPSCRWLIASGTLADAPLAKITSDIISKINSLPNGTCTFYSQVNGFGSGALRPVSQIGYFVNNSSASYALQRWDNGTTWTTGNPLNFSTGTLAIGTSNYQTLADDVCRLQFTFQLKSNGQFVTTPPSSFSNVGAVVMAVALLDKVTRKQVAPAQVTQLVSALTAVGGAYTTPEDQWTANLAAATSLPKLITQNVRICQRTFYAN